ncbi:hypothetical protein J3R03_002695 [Actinoplanes couchii]|nr:hypothetical protein [Actinoplanes couchii]
MALVRLAPAVGYVGAHPVTVRRRADDGRERRFGTRALS